MSKKPRSKKSKRQKKLKKTREEELLKRTGTRKEERKAKEQIQKQKKKKMKKKARGKEGKTEVTIGFETHAPQMAEKRKKEMEKADIIIPELPLKITEEVKEAETEEELKKLAERGIFPEALEKDFKVYKEMQREGKEIKGKMGSSKYSPFGSPEEKAKVVKEKDEERIEKLKEVIKENPGKKIYIDAGNMHTSVYHKLKTELGEEKDVKIKRKHLQEKDLHEKAGYPERVKEVYRPEAQLGRHFRFDTETAQRYKKLKEARKKKENPKEYFDNKEEYRKAKQAEEKIEKLKEQKKEFSKAMREKKEEKVDSGMSEGKAVYEALLEALKRMREKKKKKE